MKTIEVIRDQESKIKNLPTYKATSRDTGKEYKVQAGLIQNTSWVNIGGENICRYVNAYTPTVIAYIAGKSRKGEAFMKDGEIYATFFFEYNGQYCQARLIIKGCKQLVEHFQKEKNKHKEEQEEKRLRMLSQDEYKDE